MSRIFFRALLLFVFVMLTTPAALACVAINGHGCPKVNFFVFFDWDSAAIRPQGAEQIRQAAARFQEDAHKFARSQTWLLVNGFTDRSGALGHNQLLAERRACVVADELIRLGVPGPVLEISTYALFSRIRTDIGVREPQNRFAEIVIKTGDDHYPRGTLTCGLPGVRAH
jgi:outer membrane protein OmpA-like peptidoglycan-associated protein